MRAIFNTIIITIIITMACVMICLFPNTSYAYTDPSFGSFIYQLMFPILTVISIAYLAFKKNVNNLIVKIKNRLKGK